MNGGIEMVTKVTLSCCELVLRPCSCNGLSPFVVRFLSSVCSSLSIGVMEIAQNVFAHSLIELIIVLHLYLLRSIFEVEEMNTS